MFKGRVNLVLYQPQISAEVFQHLNILTNNYQVYKTVKKTPFIKTMNALYTFKERGIIVSTSLLTWPDIT